MKRLYLLDTNVLSEPIRPAPNIHLLSKLQVHKHGLVTASVVWHELLYGSQRLAASKKKAAVEAFLYDVIQPSIPILPCDGPAAAWHAAERARLAQIGRTPSFANSQIAAIAAANNCILITANTGDFAEFGGLEVENWHSAPASPGGNDRQERVLIKFSILRSLLRKPVRSLL